MISVSSEDFRYLNKLQFEICTDSISEVRIFTRYSNARMQETTKTRKFNIKRSDWTIN
jgi:hypothetical protein